MSESREDAHRSVSSYIPSVKEEVNNIIQGVIPALVKQITVTLTDGTTWSFSAGITYLGKEGEKVEDFDTVDVAWPTEEKGRATSAKRRSGLTDNEYESFTATGKRLHDEIEAKITELEDSNDRDGMKHFASVYYKRAWEIYDKVSESGTADEHEMSTWPTEDRESFLLLQNAERYLRRKTSEPDSGDSLPF